MGTPEFRSRSRAEHEGRPSSSRWFTTSAGAGSCDCDWLPTPLVAAAPGRAEGSAIREAPPRTSATGVSGQKGDTCRAVTTVQGTGCSAITARVGPRVGSTCGPLLFGGEPRGGAHRVHGGVLHGAALGLDAMRAGGRSHRGVASVLDAPLRVERLRALAPSGSGPQGDGWARWSGRWRRPGGREPRGTVTSGPGSGRRRGLTRSPRGLRSRHDRAVRRGV